MAENTASLEKKLTLLDVYAISTGAMFSAGFFLLPGIAAAQTGPSVFLAYLAAGLLILPSILSMAELSTAMPRSGGIYYFMDRSMGPMMGTIGGIGSWLALMLKSSFALIGMGAYLALLFDVPVVPLAVGLSVFFGALNAVGAKETTGLLRVLVATLLGILVFWLASGLVNFAGDLAARGDAGWLVERLAGGADTGFFSGGLNGFFATIGFVVVSYAGVTKIASVSEEVVNPDRNIPLGMLLSLATALVIYGGGVFLMVAYLPAAEFHVDYTPIATSARVFIDWLPSGTVTVLIVVAATAAFASTGNAGMLSASRYPFAMARDRLVPGMFAWISPLKTPAVAVAVTTLGMVLILVLLDVESVAKLASAIQLLLFGLLNVAVIVMRESRIEAYDPGFRSPWYPWTQVFGLFLALFLIAEMGLVSVLFTVGIVFVCMIWYFRYAASRVHRQGAIFHVHARLGERRDTRLNVELRTILREKGLRKGDPYDEVVARAVVLDYAESCPSYPEILKQATGSLVERFPCTLDELMERFTEPGDEHMVPIAQGISLNHVRVRADHPSEMVLVRLPDRRVLPELGEEPVEALIFLVSSTENAAQHLRILAHLADVVDDPEFLSRWRSAPHEVSLKEILLRDERFLNLLVDPYSPARELIGRRLREISLPGESLVAVVKRGDAITIPQGNTEILEGDELSIIGSARDIQALRRRFGLAVEG